MILERLRTGLLRDIVAALLLALTLLAGIVQARAATEKAAGLGFAGAFELCLQAGKSGPAAHDRDHNCDECRIPAFVSAPLPMPPAVHPLRIALCDSLPTETDCTADQRMDHPVSRGPPLAG